MGEVTENPELIEIKSPNNTLEIRLNTVFDPIARNAFIILNRTIRLPNFRSVWAKFSLHICGDGGANQLYDYFATPEERLKYIPDFIVGDFDSLRDDVREWYKSRGVRLIPQTTQWATDLGKCLDLAEVYYDFIDSGRDLKTEEIDSYDGLLKLHAEITSRNEVQIVLFGTIGGRFDHTIQSISQLLKLSHSNPNAKVFYLSASDLIFLVKKGITFLDYQEVKESFHGHNIGLLPLAGEVTLNTRGLKWDVHDWKSSMITAVSSSNRFVGDIGCIIEADNALIINIEIGK